MADRNGNAITPNTSYLLVGRALRDDGSTVLVDLGYRVVTATANEIAPAFGGIGTAMLGVDITAAGKALLDDANNTAQRATLGLGSSATLNMFGSGDPLGVLTAIASFAGLIHTHGPTDITGSSSDGQVLRRASGVVGWGTIPSASVTGLGTAATQNTYGSGDPLGVFTAIAVFAGLTHTHNGTDAPQLSAANITSGTLAAARGGTGQTSYTTGDILYWNGSALAKLAIGGEGQVLKVDGGVPKWSDP